MNVSNSGSNTVSVINTNFNVAVAYIPVGKGPLGIAYDSGNGMVYVSNSGSNSVSVINTSTNTVVATIPVGLRPLGYCI